MSLPLDALSSSCARPSIRARFKRQLKVLRKSVFLENCSELLRATFCFSDGFLQNMELIRSFFSYVNENVKLLDTRVPPQSRALESLRVFLLTNT
jgi:hypothetical protein